MTENYELLQLLDVLEFNQVVIFVKSVQRCTALAQLLIEQNFPAIAIHRGMNQEERLSRYQQFKDFQKVKTQLNTLLVSPIDREVLLFSLTFPLELMGRLNVAGESYKFLPTVPVGWNKFPSDTHFNVLRN